MTDLNVYGLDVLRTELNRARARSAEFSKENRELRARLARTRRRMARLRGELLRSRIALVRARQDLDELTEND